jgi:hypothetical protein
MHLVQSTGFLVDFYFFAPVSNLTIDAMPESTPYADTWNKLQNWPAFNDFLNDRYNLLEEPTPVRDSYRTRHAEHRASYRIYVLNS